ncbi:hypothetical protein [Actinacidiphila guanduensis]|uniref:Uncharacterized protein n=1 Tax=Actinacidiphila guanduensis TaxID=310781 RepID=A0A1H0SPK4_9ACTN|nr:hypothetical protein [Actinacidiphila guanduensis]SDP43178.1 hypothetical protein SAMN05216259_1308 [Actinacidiphila guanduensis]
MAGSGQIGERGFARLLMVCAVLAGLFFMHGSPTAAAEGCHGALPTALPGAAAPMSTSMGEGEGEGTTAVAARADSSPAMPRPGTALTAPAVHAGAPSMAHGAMCVSTPARARFLLPAHTLLVAVAVLAVTALGGRAAGRAWARRGQPPPGGRSLLLQVGVART